MAAAAHPKGDGTGPAKCTWVPNTPAPSPHNHYRQPTGLKILPTILSHIGNTPVVRINSLGKKEGLQCELLAKCEFFNAGGSVKDRIGLRMIEDAERQGRIKPGDTLIEPTSGNTGIGLALAAAIKGYKMIITLPEKMSQEKVDVLKALGAQIIRTPTEAAWDAPESHIGVAKRLNQEIPNSHILDQYSNPSNPLAHYDGTAEEILEQCEGRLDMIVVSAGTGGTLTGIARKLKERLPNIKVVGVDPDGSILAQPDALNSPIHSYKVEGIGYDFIPIVCERSYVDTWIKSHDRESFVIARRLMREEGLLCGGSSGSAMWAALQAARELGPGQRCLVILPDSVRNYMSKFLNDNWMVDNGFMDPTVVEAQRQQQQQYGGATVRSLALPVPVTVNPNTTLEAAVALLQQHGFDQLPVVAPESNKAVGLVTLGNLLSFIASRRATPRDPLSKVLFRFDNKRPYEPITMDTPLESLTSFFERNSVGFVTDDEKRIVGVVTKIDLLSYLIKNPQ